MILCITKHRTGYCLSRQGQEQPSGYIDTLCRHTVTLPCGLDEYNADEFVPDDGFEMCGECASVLYQAEGYATGYAGPLSARLVELARLAYKCGDRRGQVVYELARALQEGSKK